MLYGLVSIVAYCGEVRTSPIEAQCHQAPSSAKPRRVRFPRTSHVASGRWDVTGLLLIRPRGSVQQLLLALHRHHGATPDAHRCPRSATPEPHSQSPWRREPAPRSVDTPPFLSGASQPRTSAAAPVAPNHPICSTLCITQPLDPACQAREIPPLTFSSSVEGICNLRWRPTIAISFPHGTVGVCS